MASLQYFVDWKPQILATRTACQQALRCALSSRLPHVPAHCYRLSTLKLKKLQMLFYAMPSDFQKSIAFWKVPRLRPFAFLVRATCRWRWEWSIGGMIQTGEAKFLAFHATWSHIFRQLSISRDRGTHHSPLPLPISWRCILPSLPRSSQ